MKRKVLSLRSLFPCQTWPWVNLGDKQVERYMQHDPPLLISLAISAKESSCTKESAISSSQDKSYLLVFSEAESETSFHLFFPSNSFCLRATLAASSAGSLSDQCFLGWLHIQQRLFARSPHPSTACWSMSPPWGGCPQWIGSWCRVRNPLPDPPKRIELSCAEIALRPEPPHKALRNNLGACVYAHFRSEPPEYPRQSNRSRLL